MARNPIILLLVIFSFTLTAVSSPEENLANLGIELPEVSPSIANYVGAVRTGNLLFLSGHLPRDAEGGVITGKLGDDMDVEAGYAAARQSAIALLATLKAELGDLDKVVRVVKVFGMVNAAPDFTSHSQVINGCSDLLVEVFGEKGRHARAACGFSSLPLGSAVEIELIVQIGD
ncbi:MAG: RidA family protein [Puniceicoccaceae bacterium]